MSDSFNCLGGAVGDIANNDLPAGISVLEPSSCAGMIDEGRAMMQIIHDLASGSSQLFHTAFEGTAAFANGIRTLANAGAGIIVDDVYYFFEPFFQDGPIAQAVDEVTTQQGVVYFSSAGNNGDQSYESTFRPDTINNQFHDFDPGAGEDIFQRVYIPAGGEVTFIFQWTEPYASVSGPPGASTDFDILITDEPYTQILANSLMSNIGADPIDLLSFTNPGAGAYFNVVIQKYAGSGTPVLKYIYTNPSMGIDQYATPSSTVVGHANAAWAEATGSVNYWDTPSWATNPPLKASYSSEGGTPILFDTDGNPITPVFRAKPNISCVDGGNTTFFGQDAEPDGWPNFFGTSAAAPHAAALAALIKEYRSELNPLQVLQAMEGTAIDMHTVGFDYQTGAGLCDVAAALSTLNTPPYTPGSPNPSNGATDVLITQTLSWAGGDVDGDTVTYDVWLETGDATPDVLVCNDVSSANCNPAGDFAYNTLYYWKVEARDSKGATTMGPVWSFTTQEESCSGVDVVIQNRVFDGTTVCVALSTLTANTNVLVQPGADVTFNSPAVTLGNGFSVEVGAVFKVDVTPP
jgi:hypothetical protein